jgi:hypothetical protein
MRILIAAQPKAGNVWARNILANIYDLIDLNERVEHVPRHAAEFAEFVEAGLFLDDSVLHQHFNPKPEVLAGCEALDCHIITLLRNPYDAFVSFYFYVNRNKKRFQGTPSGVLINKPMEHPDVVRFLGETYRRHLLIARRWIGSGRASVLRYEDLHANPLASVRAVTERIKSVPDSQIESALEACSASQLRKRGGWLKAHIRVAATGDWEKHLQPVHLEAFREKHGSLIESLGYSVL